MASGVYAYICIWCQPLYVYISSGVYTYLNLFTHMDTIRQLGEEDLHAVSTIFLF